MKPLRILIVDDNIEVCDTMMLLLRAFHHDTERVHDATLAVQAALDFNPDVVLLDIGMPDLNGWEISLLMRECPSLKPKKIYALTGYSDPSDIQRSMESGMNYHFVKPLDIDDFWSVLKLQGVID